MSDSFPVTPGSGSNVATRSVGGVHYQKMMGDLISYQIDGTWTSRSHLSTGNGRALASRIHLPNAFLDEGGDDHPEVAEIVSFDIFTNHEMIRGYDSPSYNAYEDTGMVGLVYTASGSFNAWTNLHTASSSDLIQVHVDDFGKILAMLSFQPTLDLGSPSPIGAYHYKMISHMGQLRALVATASTDKDLWVRLMAGKSANDYSTNISGGPFTAKVVVDRIVF